MIWIIFILISVILVGYIWMLREKLSYGICRCSKNLVGKVTIVTGSNIGIGFETAKDFADRGAKVILACRNEQRGTKAVDDIIRATGNKSVYYYKIDLSSFKSIREFVDQFKKSEIKLDILVNNAGDLESEFDTTDDGLLLGMQVNYFGPFLLTNLLLPLLKSSAPSRIVNVASMAHRLGKINLQNLNEVPLLSKMGVYSNAKLCTVLSTGELKRRLEGTGVTVNVLCPGLVATNIFSKIRHPLWRKTFEWRVHLLSKDCWLGAQTQIYLAVSPEVNGVSGQYFTDCKISHLERFAKDPEVARKLWDISEQLVKLNQVDKDK